MRVKLQTLETRGPEPNASDGASTRTTPTETELLSSEDGQIGVVCILDAPVPLCNRRTMHGKRVRCPSLIGGRQKLTQSCKTPKRPTSLGSFFAVMPTIETIIASCRRADRLVRRAESSGSDGGFLFAADPHLTYSGQTIFWSPEVLPTVLRAAAATWTAISRPCRLELSKLSRTDVRRASDGWHAVVRLGGETHRLWLHELPATGTPIVIQLVLDADFDLKSDAAHRLWSALEQPALRARSAITLQRRRRLILALRALDGRLEGNSYRLIAETLFGRTHIPERGWKTHELRNRTIRLVQTGTLLMHGDYLVLLRRRRIDP